MSGPELGRHLVQRPRGGTSEAPGYLPGMSERAGGQEGGQRSEGAVLGAQTVMGRKEGTCEGKMISSVRLSNVPKVSHSANIFWS